jgi:hypothetical protein
VKGQAEQVQKLADLLMGSRATLLVGYTYSKSIDDASNLGEQTNP